MRNTSISSFDLNHLFVVNSVNPQIGGSHDMVDGEFNHSICSEEFLQELDGVWFAKLVETERKARFEILSQELFRLFLPHQPKTVYGTGRYIIKDQRFGSTELQHFVLSKKIENLCPLPKGRQSRFFHGSYKNLGHIMALSIFLHEIDLSVENICLDIYGRVVKIDGDWTLASIANPERFTPEMNTKIDARLLLDVFFFDHYSVYNWFDIIAARVKKETSEIIPSEIMSSPAFLNELYEMILWIVLLPEDIYQKLIEVCVGHVESTRTFEIHMQRKMNLLESALQNVKFFDYMKGKKLGEIEIPVLIKEHMFKFVLHKDSQLISEDAQKLFDEQISENQRFVDSMILRFQSSPKSVEHSFSRSFTNNSYSSMRTTISSTRNLSSISGIYSNVVTPTRQIVEETSDDEFYDESLTI